MNLKNFISQTIIEIIDGLTITTTKLKNKKVGLYSSGKNNQRHIEFDVAVETREKKGKGGEAGIRVLEVVKIGGKKSSEFINSTVSRVRFGVRISDVKK